MTALERLIWLDELRAKYPTVEEAAKASHVSRNTINHHCRRLHGVSYACGLLLPLRSPPRFH